MNVFYVLSTTQQGKGFRATERSLCVSGGESRLQKYIWLHQVGWDQMVDVKPEKETVE